MDRSERDVPRRGATGGEQVSLDVHVHDVMPPCLELSFDFPQGIMATASGSEPIAAWREMALEYGFDDQFHRTLHHTIFDCGDAERAGFRASGLGDSDPSDRAGDVVVIGELLFDGEQPVFAVFTEELYADPVNAAGACVAPDLFPSDPKGPFRTNFVDQTEPLVSFYPSFKGDEHGFAPHSALGSVALPQILSSLFIPCGN